jgi:hypothetical protein
MISKLTKLTKKAFMVEFFASVASFRLRQGFGGPP